MHIFNWQKGFGKCSCLTRDWHALSSCFVNRHCCVFQRSRLRLRRIAFFLFSLAAKNSARITVVNIKQKVAQKFIEEFRKKQIEIKQWYLSTKKT